MFEGSFLVRLLPVMSFALLQGCAAILGSKSTNVAAISQPPGADVYVDGARVGVTPDTIAVESKKSHTMVLRLAGYKEDSCALPSSVDGGWVVLDVLLGGLVGIIVDAASGEWNELTRKSCNHVLSPTAATDPAVVADEPRRNREAVQLLRTQQQASQPFRSSAPNEPVTELVKAERRVIVGDMLRTDLVTAAEQGPPGILRVGIGDRFHEHEGREYYFGQLASAYATWTVKGHPLIIELWEDGAKIGEYTEQAFFIGPGYTTPLDCPEGATSGLCGSLGQVVQENPPPAQSLPVEPSAPVPQAMPVAGPVPATPGAESKAHARDRSGFHFGLGLGAGAVDLVCDGCEFESQTGFSGFLSLGGAIGEKTVLGIESTGWTKEEAGVSSQVYSLMAHVTEYANTSSGLFLRAGLGVVGYREEDLSANAFGFSGRLGYELGTGSALIVPYVGYVQTFGGAELQLDGEDIGFDFAIGNFQLGLSVSAY